VWLKIHIYIYRQSASIPCTEMIYSIDSMAYRSFLQLAPPPIDLASFISSHPELLKLPPVWQKALADRMHTQHGQEVWANGQAMRAGRASSISTYPEGGGMCCARVRMVACGFCGVECVKPIERDPLVKSLFAKVYQRTSLICSRCELMHYCSPACQLADWTTHRLECKR
jgi:hypothetical protein